MTNVHTYELSVKESTHARDLIDRITSQEGMRDPEKFLASAYVMAHELPRSVRSAFYDFKRAERHSALLIRHTPELATDLGPTPISYVEQEPGFELNDWQILHGLFASLLGEPFGYTSQRGGACYNSIIPRQELADVPNSSSGFKNDFGWHIEDAFDSLRPDYLGLACMRNDEKAGTSISSIDGIENTLDGDEIRFLFERRFNIRHNPIHSTTGVVNEEQQPVFFGHPDRPYVRVNFANLAWSSLLGMEKTILAKLQDHFENNKVTLELKAGDMVYIDNYTTPHARDAYVPLPPGESRWLSRLCVMSDLRASSHRRPSVASRAIQA
jgi:hypothetical protein